ncbi:MAG TPA: hypothetical protein ENK09_12985 [Nitrospirae bacterium]|nr:hypothetical protein [Nitrospirota bacterium]
MSTLWKRINVRAYAGMKGMEKPREIFFDDHSTVVKVLSEWLEEGLHFRERRRYFRVVSIETKREYLIYHDLKSNQWFVKPAS